MEKPASIEGVSDLNKKELPGKTGEALSHFVPELEGRVNDGKLDHDVWYGKNTWQLVVGGETEKSDDEIYGRTYKEHQANILEYDKEGKANEAGKSLFDALKAVDAEIGVKAKASSQEGYGNGWLFRDISRIVESMSEDNSVESVKVEIGGILEKIKTYRFADDELNKLGPEVEIEAALTMVVGLMSGREDVIKNGIEEHKKWEDAHKNAETAAVDVDSGNVESDTEDLERQRREREAKINKYIEDNRLGVNASIDKYTQGRAMVLRVEGESGKGSIKLQNPKMYLNIVEKIEEQLRNVSEDDEERRNELILLGASMQEIKNCLSDEDLKKLKDEMNKDQTTAFAEVEGENEVRGQDATANEGGWLNEDYKGKALWSIDGVSEEIVIEGYLGKGDDGVDYYKVAGNEAGVPADQLGRSEVELRKQSQVELFVRQAQIELWKGYIEAMTEEQKQKFGVTEDQLKVLEEEIATLQEKVKNKMERGVLLVSPTDSEVTDAFMKMGKELTDQIDNQPEEAKKDFDKLVAECDELLEIDSQVADESVFVMGVFGQELMDQRLKELVGDNEYKVLDKQVNDKYKDIKVEELNKEIGQVLKKIGESTDPMSVDAVKDKVMYSLMERELVRKLKEDGLLGGLEMPKSVEEGLKLHKEVASKLFDTESEPEMLDIAKRGMLREWAAKLPKDQRDLYHRALENMVVDIQMSADGISELAKNPKIIKERIFDADAMAYALSTFEIPKDVMSGAVEDLMKETAMSRERATSQAVEIMGLEQQALMGNKRAQNKLRAMYVAQGVAGAGVAAGVGVAAYSLGWWLFFPLFFDAAVQGLKAGLGEQGLKV